MATGKQTPDAEIKKLSARAPHPLRLVREQDAGLPPEIMTVMANPHPNLHIPGVLTIHADGRVEVLEEARAEPHEGAKRFWEAVALMAPQYFRAPGRLES